MIDKLEAALHFVSKPPLSDRPDEQYALPVDEALRSKVLWGRVKPAEQTRSKPSASTLS